MNIFHQTFSIQDLKLSTKIIEKAMGYESNSIPEPFPEMILNNIENVEKYCVPEGGFVIIENPVFIERKALLIINGIEFGIKKIIFDQLNKSDKIAVFLCTAGKWITDYSHKMTAEGDLLNSYIVDTIGSVIVDLAMDKIQDELEQLMQKEQLHITNRYSPGYCGWKVEEQQKIFTFFPENFCNVKLSDTSLMYPLKSVSGIIGIGRNVHKGAYPCKTCDSTNCTYRKQ